MHAPHSEKRSYQKPPRRGGTPSSAPLSRIYEGGVSTTIAAFSRIFELLIPDTTNIMSFLLLRFRQYNSFTSFNLPAESSGTMLSAIPNTNGERDGDVTTLGPLERDGRRFHLSQLTKIGRYEDRWGNMKAGIYPWSPARQLRQTDHIPLVNSDYFHVQLGTCKRFMFKFFRGKVKCVCGSGRVSSDSVASEKGS